MVEERQKQLSTVFGLHTVWDRTCLHLIIDHRSYPEREYLFPHFGVGKENPPPESNVEHPLPVTSPFFTTTILLILESCVKNIVVLIFVLNQHQFYDDHREVHQSLVYSKIPSQTFRLVVESTFLGLRFENL